MDLIYCEYTYDTYVYMYVLHIPFPLGIINSYYEGLFVSLNKFFTKILIVTYLLLHAFY